MNFWDAFKIMPFKMPIGIIDPLTLSEGCKLNFIPFKLFIN
jgi:hypothetical protein